MKDHPELPKLKQRLYIRVASAYSNNKKEDEQALIYYDKATHVEKHSDSYTAYIRRATHKVRMKNLQGAADDFNMALKLRPDDPDIVATRGLYLYYPIGDYQAALADCKKARQLATETTEYTIYNVYKLCIMTKQKLGMEKQARADVIEAGQHGLKRAKSWLKEAMKEN